MSQEVASEGQELARGRGAARGGQRVNLDTLFTYLQQNNRLPPNLLLCRARPLPLPELLFQDSNGIAAPSFNANTATDDPSSDGGAPGHMVCPRFVIFVALGKEERCTAGEHGAPFGRW